MEVERRVLGQDGGFQTAQLGAGLDPQLFDQDGPRPLERPQGVGLTS